MLRLSGFQGINITPKVLTSLPYFIFNGTQIILFTTSFHVQYDTLQLLTSNTFLQKYILAYK